MEEDIMTSNEEHSLDNLGLVLGVQNQIHRDMLELMRKEQADIKATNERLCAMLTAQQKRQTAIILTAIALVMMSIFLSYKSVITLSERVDAGVEVLLNEHQQKTGERLSK